MTREIAELLKNIKSLLGSLDTKTPSGSTLATTAKQDIGDASLASIDTKLTGESTAAKQDTGNTSLASIDTKLTSQSTAAKQDTGNASLASIDTKLTSEATAARQDTGNTSLASMDGKLPTTADTEVSLFNGTSPAAAGTHAETGVTGFSAYSKIKLVAFITGATGDTLDVYVQTSTNGTRWYDLAHFITALAADAQVVQAMDLEISTDPVTIGTDTSPALEMGGNAGHWSDRLRVVEKAGTSTSAGGALEVVALCSKGVR